MRKLFLVLLPFAGHLAAASLLPLPWNKAETQSQQQQQKWLHDQQAWNGSCDPRLMERKMKKEHQKWERAQKKREKDALKSQQSLLP